MTTSTPVALLEQLSSKINVTAFVTLLTIVLFIVLRRRRRTASAKVSDGSCALPPCLPSLPIVGSLPFIIGIKDLRDPGFLLLRVLADFFLRKRKELGGVVAFYAMNKYVKLIQWNIVQRVTTTQIDNHYRDNDRLPSLDDVVYLPYVEATILEVLRFETLLPMIANHRTLNDTELHGYFIPGGTAVYANLHGAHMDPDEWEEPGVFRPERFINQEGKLTGSERVLTFSLGKRACLSEQLGRQQLFTILTSILRYFDIRQPEGQTRITVTRLPGSGSVPSDFDLRLIPRRSTSGVSLFSASGDAS